VNIHVTNDNTEEKYSGKASPLMYARHAFSCYLF